MSKQITIKGKTYTYKKTNKDGKPIIPGRAVNAMPPKKRKKAK